MILLLNERKNIILVVFMRERLVVGGGLRGSIIGLVVHRTTKTMADN